VSEEANPSGFGQGRRRGNDALHVDVERGRYCSALILKKKWPNKSLSDNWRYRWKRQLIKRHWQNSELVFRLEFKLRKELSAVSRLVLGKPRTRRRLESEGKQMNHQALW